MPDVSTKHSPELAHHVRQGIAWLSASAEGENTAALSYAAFELRFAIERLAVHYWRALLNRTPEEKDLRDIESFKRVERRIYELAGHQREIDGHFEFMRICLGCHEDQTRPFSLQRLANCQGYGTNAASCATLAGRWHARFLRYERSPSPTSRRYLKHYRHMSAA